MTTSPDAENLASDDDLDAPIPAIAVWSFRQRLGLTEEQMGVMSGMNAATIIKWERQGVTEGYEKAARARFAALLAARDLLGTPEPTVRPTENLPLAEISTEELMFELHRRLGNKN